MDDTATPPPPGFDEGEEETDSHLYPDDYLEQNSRPSSRASSNGRVSPLSDMENVAWGELPVEKVYDYFAHATSLAGVLRAFEELKTKLEVGDQLSGLDLYRELKGKLSTQKTWKARDVFQMLEKRANQEEYMGQRAAEDVRVLIGESRERERNSYIYGKNKVCRATCLICLFVFCSTHNTHC